jgi:hypothetical protein
MTFEIFRCTLSHWDKEILCIKGHLNHYLPEPYQHVLVTSVESSRDGLSSPYAVGTNISYSEFSKGMLNFMWKLKDIHENPNIGYRLQTDIETVIEEMD